MTTMTAPESGRGPDPTALPTPTRSMTPPSARTVTTVAAVVLLLTAGTIAGLLWWINTSGLTGTELTTARLDAIKIGLSIAIGGGGGFALYLAWRRQRSNEADHQQREHALEHQQHVADDTKHDALERRVTELYTKAADQLGSDKAPVRLAGLYALERLAQNNPDQRETIVNVLCAYLRMPYDLPTGERLDQPVAAADDDAVIEDGQAQEGDRRDKAGDDSGSPELPWRSESELQRIQELQVRLAAQNILAKHLRPSSSSDGASRSAMYWHNIDLDLAGATLVGLDLSHCRLRSANFTNAKIVGDAWFTATEFIQVAVFHGVRIICETASFENTRFAGRVTFEEAMFGGASTSFKSAKLEGRAFFSGAYFAGNAYFDDATFVGEADLTGASFIMGARFDRANFTHDISFAYAEFGAGATFNGARFAGEADFTCLTFGNGASFIQAEFCGDASFSEARFAGPARFNGAKFMGDAAFIEAKFDQAAAFSRTAFAAVALFDSANFAHGRPAIIEKVVNDIRREPLGNAAEPEGS